MMEKDAKIYVAGHRGMVGSAIVRELERQGYTNIITRTHSELDLCRQDEVEKFFAEEKPEYVFLAAAKVGGIVANQEALADFMYDNMILDMNVIHSAWQNSCKKLEFLGSSCIYPRMAPQPMPESCLLTSELEKTNEAYALAKISGLKYCTVAVVCSFTAPAESLMKQAIQKAMLPGLPVAARITAMRPRMAPEIRSVVLFFAKSISHIPLWNDL